ncbi:winged helix-turn-helix transcriptional regulator [Rhizobium hidalgonense]|uniref:Helix-turn-helix domain-containing protein n=1 Tax=Rhizobium hidalgonense TaxID=1538159 RepID=A0A2A6KGX2_9HYPH|nr:helix-turn-helix domain-containing protein [Rhizobium hidalgonense]EJC72657.1 putative transcriptional regulator [Rhizobium leguminosarum bv. trifolii WSM2012]MDR9771143.1 helix-turn-helix domain-containing protein [Rhizobium hidalgonense]MDR9805450.1 helix-turn-helix domain-containing protein [Rhizobium hidalgonense]MDR9809303.1 helix-turn-helix domain-containing protein [Rhizobium hidalgonense]MDR9818827.1 helix-turn-helix domain-containing protein [Rhizobium hidalgonense]
MQRTSFSDFKCPVARALDSVGDWWSILILRDAFQGLSRFDDFQKSLGVAPNILTRRLKHLTDQELFERRLYHQRPARYEYVLTDKGRDFFPVLMTLFSWGSRHIPEEDLAFLLGDTAGKSRQTVLVDTRTGEQVTPENTSLLAGPAADDEVRARIARMRAWYLGIDA